MQSVLLLDEIGVPIDFPQVNYKLYHIMLYRVHLTWAAFELTTCKSNYHTITTTMVPPNSINTNKMNNSLNSKKTNTYTDVNPGSGSGHVQKCQCDWWDPNCSLHTIPYVMLFDFTVSLKKINQTSNCNQVGEISISLHLLKKCYAKK